jgi:putative ABC transport system permease protein
VSLRTLLFFYGQRWRTQRTAELLAGAGIAAGVALVFAVIVANASIAASAGQIMHGIAGAATLQLDARDDHGFPAALAREAAALPSVEHAAGILEHRAIVDGPRGRQSVVLVGVDASLASLGGTLTQNFAAARGLSLGDGLLLPSGLAARLGVDSGVQAGRRQRARTVQIRVRGRSREAAVSAVLGEDLIGPISDALVAVAPRPYVERLTGRPARLTRVFVAPRPGQEAAARRQLEALAGAGVAVTSADNETTVLAQASAPNNQSTSLFAAISALVGFLLAFNAMLLTAPERRRENAERRLQGFTPRQVAGMAVFDAVLLGAVASAAGVGVGLVLARTLFGGVPTYLAFAFPLGAQQVVAPSTVLLAFAGGIACTLLAAAQPLLDLRPGRALDAVFNDEGEPGQALGARARRHAGLAAIALVALASALAAAVPAATLVAIAALALATLLALPAGLVLALALADRLSRRRGVLAMLAVAVMALRATRVRAIALAATGAVAVFGSVAIEGAHRDLERGLHDSFQQYLGTTDLWITTGGDDLTTEDFDPGDAVARVAAVPGVADVRRYHGGLLDVGQRRAWVIARSPRDRTMLPAGQVQAGDPAEATAALRRTGSVAASEKIAESLGARLGERIAIPTPSGPLRLRLVATLTNLGWGPGALVMNAADYTAAWRTRDPTALEVDLRPGTDPRAARAAVQRALGAGLALRAQTTGERIVQYDGLAREGLKRLTHISLLLLLAAAISLAAATGAAIWQRRASLADYRLHGYLPRQLWSALVLESGIVLVSGCALGAASGLYGQKLLGRWLQQTTGFPAPFAPSPAATLGAFLLVAVVALLAIAIPTYRAVQVKPGAGLVR